MIMILNIFLKASFVSFSCVIKILRPAFLNSIWDTDFLVIWEPVR